MSALHKIEPIGVDAYLEGEREAEVRHEYVDGYVYAMAGAGERHNRIALNLAMQLRLAARGGPCGVFMSDMKVRVASRNAFYYPDVALVCDPTDDGEYVKQRPCLVAEVASPATRAMDRREKLLAYRELESLRYYLLIASDRREVEYFVRAADGEWQTARLEPGETLEVACGDYHTVLDLEAVYEDVRL